MEDNKERLLRIGKLIHIERKRKKLTRAVLAEKAGLSIQTIGNIENGNQCNFKIDTFLLLIDALDLSADYVIGLDKKSSGLEAECRTLTEKQKCFVLSMIKRLKEYDSEV